MAKSVGGGGLPPSYPREPVGGDEQGSAGDQVSGPGAPGGSNGAPSTGAPLACLLQGASRTARTLMYLARRVRKHGGAGLQHPLEGHVADHLEAEEAPRLRHVHPPSIPTATAAYGLGELTERRRDPGVGSTTRSGRWGWAGPIAGHPRRDQARGRWWRQGRAKAAR